MPCDRGSNTDPLGGSSASMRLDTALWRSPGCRRLSPSRGLCCLAVTLLVVNVLSLYGLHRSPSPWMHAHGGMLPRHVAVLPFQCHGGLPLRFLHPPAPHLTALASVPGSGNTWVRHLLQQATGVVTGSMYEDTLLKTAGFPGEGISNGSVLVVKTHDAHPAIRRHFRHAVLLIRHPRDAILAEFNRLHGGHLGHASPADFEKEWESFVPDAIDAWTVFTAEWLTFTGNLHIVHYEDLQRNLSSVLSDLLGFLNVTVSNRDLRYALEHSTGSFKRKKNWRTTGVAGKDIFSQEIETRIANSVEQIRKTLQGGYRVP